MATQTEDRMISEKIASVLVARTLGPFDLVVIFVAIVLFIINSAGLQAAGPSVFVFWTVAFATFLITGAFVTAQLGRMFPEEGSLYVWTHKALGPFWGFFAGFVAWWPGPITMVVIGVLVANFLQQTAAFFTCSGKPCAILTENWQIGIVVLVVLWFSASMSYLKMRVTQNYVNVQFFAYAAAIFLIGFAGVVWLLKGHPSATSFGSGWNPFQGDKLALGVPANLTFFSFAILALLGIETPLNMGVEVTGGERAIRTYLFWGCIIVMAAYLWATWGNMVVIQAGGANATTGGAQTVALAIGKWAGVLVALVLAWVLLTVAVVYNFAFGRLLFVSGLEKRLPHQVGRVNKNKVPANAVTLQTAIASIIAILLFFILGAGGKDPYKVFYALYAGLTIVWCISTALLFLDIFFARRAAPARFEEARRIPLGWLFICGAIGTIVNLLAVFFIFIGSWYPTGYPRLAEWNAWMFGITGFSVITGILIYAISQRTRRGKSDEQLLTEMAPAGTGGGGE
ncbi:MAG: APC family permease [Actinobacteria bacterium]|nr:MAG: APC family permease [Actinomycetota bacterium]